MKKPKLRELGEAVKALVRGPATDPFPARPHVPFPSFRGKVKYSKDDCIGCGACAEVCPSQCITVTDDVSSDPPMRRFEQYWAACIFCGQCQLNCTTEKGVRLTSEWDLACFDRTGCIESVEKPLVLCEVCRSVIGCRDHLLWVAERLGAKRYANPTLILLADGEMGLVGAPTPRDPDRPLDRGDTLRVLCPSCRRAAVLREAWGA
ncbi:MAG: 4Fe-4S dicluster domain-containing protein [Planctomycetes bacterium]|nr:4Fe-4S dicluster domain-containing protein [Planctomycetota bacterium]